MPDMPSASERATTKPWQPAGRQRPPPTSFDRYGTFPDIGGDDDDDEHDVNSTLTTRQYHRANSNRSLGSGTSGGDAPLDPDYDIVPMYVVPLFKHQLVVIPAPKPGPGGKQGPEWMSRVVTTGQAVQKKAAETWDSLKNSDPDSLKSKVYRYELMEEVGRCVCVCVWCVHGWLRHPFTHHNVLQTSFPCNMSYSPFPCNMSSQHAPCTASSHSPFPHNLPSQHAPCTASPHSPFPHIPHPSPPP